MPWRCTGRPAWALESFDTAARLTPSDPVRQLDRTNALRQLGRPVEAEAAARAALALAPDLAAGHLDLGSALRDQGRFAAAEQAYRQALVLQPGAAQGLSHLGTVLRDLGRPAEAEAMIRRALRSTPNLVQTRYELAITLLLTGRWAQGWRLFEARLSVFSTVRVAGPAWSGDPLGGRTLLVQHEQGFGDIIQFSRLLGGIDGRVILRVRPALSRLMRSLAGIEVVGEDEALPEFDMQTGCSACPICSGCRAPCRARRPGCAPIPDWWRPGGHGLRRCRVAGSAWPGRAAAPTWPTSAGRCRTRRRAGW